jgi:hypothetical protein
MVFVLVGLGVAALVREARAPIGWATAAVALAALLGWNLTHLPPGVNRDGGFPAGDLAAHRADDALTTAGIDRVRAVPLRSLPDFKSTEAVAYPLVRLGRSVHAPMAKGLAPGSVASGATADALVVLCDQLFRDAIGSDCGGPAEDAYARTQGLDAAPLERLEAAPGRWVSVYAAPEG